MNEQSNCSCVQLCSAPLHRHWSDKFHKCRFRAPACPSRSSQRSVDMTTGTRSHVPTTVFHEASSLRQCGESFETWKLTLMPFRCSFICAMRCTGLELCVPPRASDRLKCTSNDAQHEVKGSCQPPTAKTPVATTIVQDDSSALLRRTTRS